MHNKIQTEQCRGQKRRRISVENQNQIESTFFVSRTFMKVDNAENVKHSIETVHIDMMMSIAAHPWHRYTHRQTVRNNSTILLVF